MSNIIHPTVSLDAAIQLITQVIVPGGSVPHLTGKSGIGKTSAALEIARLLGAEFDPALHVANFSGSGPAEATGYGIPGPWNSDTDADIDLRFSAGRGLPTFNRYGFTPVLWVWDEYTNWPGEIIANSRGCITPMGFPKKWGDHVIAPNTIIVITSNRRSDGSRMSAVLDAPNVARVTTLIVQPNVADTLDHFASLGLSQSDHWTWLKFVESGSKDGGNGAFELEKFFAPDPAQPWTGEPYPCPRQHEAACRMTLPDAPLLGMDHTAKVAVLSGLVGAEAGMHSAGWSTVMKESITVARAVLSGADPMPTDPTQSYPVMMAAFRMERKRIASLDENQKAAAVKSGDLDDFINRVLIKGPGELRRCVFEMAIRRDADGVCSIPLDMHSKASLLQGV
jgi:DNA polymerase III delta prime subunit